MSQKLVAHAQEIVGQLLLGEVVGDHGDDTRWEIDRCDVSPAVVGDLAEEEHPGCIEHGDHGETRIDHHVGIHRDALGPDANQADGIEPGAQGDCCRRDPDQSKEPMEGFTGEVCPRSTCCRLLNSSGTHQQGKHGDGCPTACAKISELNPILLQKRGAPPSMSLVAWAGSSKARCCATWNWAGDMP